MIITTLQAPHGRLSGLCGAGDHRFSCSAHHRANFLASSTDAGCSCVEKHETSFPRLPPWRSKRPNVQPPRQRITRDCDAQTTLAPFVVSNITPEAPHHRFTGRYGARASNRAIGVRRWRDCGGSRRTFGGRIFRKPRYLYRVILIVATVPASDSRHVPRTLAAVIDCKDQGAD